VIIPGGQPVKKVAAASAEKNNKLKNFTGSKARNDGMMCTPQSMMKDIVQA